MPTVVHVVGIADLGLRKGESIDQVLQQLSMADVETKKKILVESRRSEPEHSSMSPLESLLTHVEMALSDEGARRRWELILVVTDQDPPDRNDTRIIGEAIVEVLRDTPEAFGHAVRPHLVVVPDMSAEAFARSMAEVVKRSFIPQPVIVGLAGGPVIASLGVLGGLLNAGVKPSIIEVNRQDLNLAVEVSLIGIEPDVREVLARSRQYSALASEYDATDFPDHRALCKVLAASVEGEWEATETQHVFRDSRFRECAKALSAPRLNGELRKPRGDAEGDTWDAWSRSLRRTIIHRVATNDGLALALTDSFLHAKVNSLLDQYSADIRRCAELVGVQKMAKAVSQRITTKRWGPSFEPILRDRDQLSIDELSSRIAQSMVGSLSSMIEGVVKNQRATPYEVVFDRYFLDHPDELPESVKSIATGIWRSIYDEVGPGARHRLRSNGVQSLRTLLIEAGITEDDDEKRAIELLGLRPPVPLDADRRIAVMCVGQSHTPPDDPMLRAVLEHVSQYDDVHLLLVTSGGERGTHDTALKLLEQADAALPGRCSVVVCQDSFGVAPVRRDVRDALEALDLDEVRLIQIFVGPGTKAQNIGSAIAGVEISLELAAEFELRTLSPVRRDDGSLDTSRTRVSPALSASEGWKRIIPDEQIARICMSALDRADVEIWQVVERISGSSWDGIVDELRNLAHFVGSSVEEWKDNPTPHRSLESSPSLSSQELLAARIQLIWKMRRSAPRTTAARAALTISDAVEDQGEDAWQRRGPATQILWGNRIAVLREPWGALRDLPPLGEVLAELDLPTLDPWPLSDLIDEIERDIAQLSETSSAVDLINLTPHPVVIISESGEKVSIPVCGTAPRVALERIDLNPLNYAGRDIPFGTSRLRSDVTDLPDPDPRYILIVSRMVAEALSDRDDLVFPDVLVRDQHDAIIGCRRLSRIVRDELTSE